MVHVWIRGEFWTDFHKPFYSLAYRFKCDFSTLHASLGRLPQSLLCPCMLCQSNHSPCLVGLKSDADSHALALAMSCTGTPPFLLIHYDLSSAAQLSAATLSSEAALITSKTLALQTPAEDVQHVMLLAVFASNQRMLTVVPVPCMYLYRSNSQQQA